MIECYFYTLAGILVLFVTTQTEFVSTVNRTEGADVRSRWWLISVIVVRDCQEQRRLEDNIVKPLSP